MWLCRGTADDSEAATSGDDELGRSGQAGQGREARQARRRGMALPGEDRFMRLDDMEAFLQDAERTAATADDDASPGAFQAMLVFLVQLRPRPAWRLALGSALLVQAIQHCADEDEAGGPDGGEADGEETEEAAALDALLDDAAGMVGGRSRKRVRFEESASGTDSDDEAGGGAGAMYADFFGSRGAPLPQVA